MGNLPTENEYRYLRAFFSASYLSVYPSFSLAHNQRESINGFTKAVKPKANRRKFGSSKNIYEFIFCASSIRF